MKSDLTYLIIGDYIGNRLNDSWVFEIENKTMQTKDWFDRYKQACNFFNLQFNKFDYFEPKNEKTNFIDYPLFSERRSVGDKYFTELNKKEIGVYRSRISNRLISDSASAILEKHLFCSDVPNKIKSKKPEKFIEAFLEFLFYDLIMEGKTLVFANIDGQIDYMEELNNMKKKQGKFSTARKNQPFIAQYKISLEYFGTVKLLPIPTQADSLPKKQIINNYIGKGVGDETSIIGELFNCREQ
jgi:hypothetical protein